MTCHIYWFAAFVTKVGLQPVQLTLRIECSEEASIVRVYHLPVDQWAGAACH